MDNDVKDAIKISLILSFVLSLFNTILAGYLYSIVTQLIEVKTNISSPAGSLGRIITPTLQSMDFFIIWLVLFASIFIITFIISFIIFKLIK